MSCDVTSCTPAGSCANPFTRVMVSHIIRGGSRVMWQIAPTFREPEPWIFQLEAGKTGNPLADDWVEVGLAVEGGVYAIDDVQRLFGKSFWTTYRVRLTTADNQVFYSNPTALQGVLDPPALREAREIARQETVRFRAVRAPIGYLLKRRHAGTPCTCLDFQTEEITQPDCTTCYGTGWLDGYFAPIPCVYADFGLVSREHIQDGARGTINPIVVPVRMLAEPRLDQGDVWVNKKTDERWYVGKITSIAEVSGVPVVVSVEFHLLPFSDAIYELEIAGQVD